jgi:hypothetical protein
MHHLPDSFDVSVFQGKSIEMVCLATNMTTLHFGPSLSVRVDGSIGIGLRGEPSSVHPVPVRTLQLFDLIGTEVLQSERIDLGSIRLHLSNDMFVEFLEDSSPFESYIIRIGNSEIVV